MDQVAGAQTDGCPPGIFVGSQVLVITLEHVSKTYRQGDNDIPALVDLSLHIPRGQHLSIMGPSGSGKSTLLHLIGGLDTATVGTITIDGQVISQMDDDALTLFRRRRIGFVFQFFNLLPTLSAEENVALPLLLDGRGLASIRGQVSALLELVGLGHRRTHRPGQLSGGEMQRVALARALVTEPALLLADEPTGNLDSHTGEEVLRLLRATTERLGQTVVLVTHDPRTAAWGDRTITLRDGRLSADEANGEARVAVPGGP
jgi:putative ABC transport system ATP-binding protein